MLICDRVNYVTCELHEEISTMRSAVLSIYSIVTILYTKQSCEGALPIYAHICCEPLIVTIWLAHLNYFRNFAYCAFLKITLSPYLSTVVLMWSIRGELELSYQAYVYLPLFAILVSQSLSRGFGTYLSRHGKVFVALYATGSFVNRHGGLSMYRILIVQKIYKYIHPYSIAYVGWMVM